MHALLTRARSCHFAVTSYSPETSGARTCDGDGKCLGDNYDVEGQGEVSENMSPLTA